MRISNHPAHPFINTSLFASHAVQINLWSILTVRVSSLRPATSPESSDHEVDELYHGEEGSTQQHPHLAAHVTDELSKVVLHELFIV